MPWCRWHDCLQLDVVWWSHVCTGTAMHTGTLRMQRGATARMPGHHRVMTLNSGFWLDYGRELQRSEFWILNSGRGRSGLPDSEFWILNSGT